MELRHPGIRPVLSCAAVCCCVVLLLFAPMSFSAESAGAAKTESGGDDPAFVQGYVSGKYVYRQSRLDTDFIRDEDIFTELRFDLSKPISNAYEFHFFGTLRDDLSSNSDRHTFSPFEDIGNAYDQSVVGYLYEAHLDLNNPGPRITQLRIGRQDGNRGEPVFFDGMAADISLSGRLRMSLYGGAAVHFYELGYHWGDDWLGGLGFDYVPRLSTAISVDYLYTEDKRDLYNTTSQYDSLISFKLIQRFSPNLKATLKARSINNDPRDASIRLAATSPETGLELIAAYFRQFRVQNELSNELSPEYDIMGQLNPYQTFDVRGRLLLGGRLSLDLGYLDRQLMHESEESAMNRSFRRAYAVLDIADLFVAGASLSFIGEEWRSGSREFSSGGVDAGYSYKRAGRTRKINIGSYYSLYKYDSYFSYGERTSVRTYYVKVEYPFAGRYSFNGTYEFERGLEEYQTAKLGIRYDF